MASLSRRTKEADSSSSQPAGIFVSHEDMEALSEGKDLDSIKKIILKIQAKKPVEEKKHSAKWDKCVTDVSKKGSSDNPHAVCTSQLGDSSYESDKKCSCQECRKKTKESASATPTGPETSDLYRKCVNDVNRSGSGKDAGAVCRDKLGDDFYQPQNLKSAIAWEVQEADIENAPRFRVALIEVGLGNFVDGAFYSEESLQKSFSIFEGKKVYADHPSRTDEVDRPERSVRDILGHFENCRYEKSDGVGMITADLVPTDDESTKWAESQMIHALKFKQKFPDKEFIGLSINASGQAEEVPIEEAMQMVKGRALDKLYRAKEMGITKVNYVTQIEDAISCDLVTEAGAGGKILKLLEEAKMAKDKKVVKEGDKSDDQDSSGHKDADQDKQLMKKMIKKHMGDDSDDGDVDAAHEAYENYKEMGMEHDQAMKHASAHVKVEKMKASKKETAPPVGGAKQDGAEAHKEKSACEDAGVKEAEIMKLAGRVAFLETENKKMELDRLMERTFSESKLPHSATKLFKEKAGEIKTKEEFTKLWNIFKEATQAKGVGEGSPFVISMTKANIQEQDSNKLDLSDCVID